MNMNSSEAALGEHAGRSSAATGNTMNPKVQQVMEILSVEPKMAKKLLQRYRTVEAACDRYLANPERHNEMLAAEDAEKAREQEAKRLHAMTAEERTAENVAKLTAKMSEMIFGTGAGPSGEEHSVLNSTTAPAPGVVLDSSDPEKRKQLEEGIRGLLLAELKNQAATGSSSHNDTSSRPLPRTVDELFAQHPNRPNMLCVPCPKFLGKREGYYFGKKNYQYGTKDKNAYSDSAAQIVDEVETIVGYHKDLKKPAEGRRYPGGQHRYDFLSDDEYSEQEDQERSIDYGFEMEENRQRGMEERPIASYYQSGRDGSHDERQLLEKRNTTTSGSQKKSLPREFQQERIRQFRTALTRLLTCCRRIMWLASRDFEFQQFVAGQLELWFYNVFGAPPPEPEDEKSKKGKNNSARQKQTATSATTTSMKSVPGGEAASSSSGVAAAAPLNSKAGSEQQEDVAYVSPKVVTEALLKRAEARAKEVTVTAGIHLDHTALPLVHNMSLPWAEILALPSTHRHDVAESPSPDTFLFRTHCPSADLKEFSVCAAEATRRLALLPGKIKGACAGGSNKMVDGVPAHLQPADVLPSGSAGGHGFTAVGGASTSTGKKMSRKNDKNNSSKMKTTGGRGTGSKMKNKKAGGEQLQLQQEQVVEHQPGLRLGGIPTKKKSAIETAYAHDQVQDTSGGTLLVDANNDHAEEDHGAAAGIGDAQPPLLASLYERICDDGSFPPTVAQAPKNDATLDTDSSTYLPLDPHLAMRPKQANLVLRLPSDPKQSSYLAACEVVYYQSAKKFSSAERLDAAKNSKKPANAGTVNSDGTSAAADSVLGFLDGGDSNVEQPRWATTEKMGKEWMLRARKALQSFQQPMHHYASDAHISPKGKLFFALDQYVTELAQLSVMDEVRQSLIEEVAFCIGMAMEKVLVTDRNADLEMQGAASSEAAGAGEGLHDPTTAALLRNKDSVYVAQLSHKIAYQLVRDICDPRKLRDCVLADATNALLFDRRRRDLRCAVATMKMSVAKVDKETESETETRKFLEKLQGVLLMKMQFKDYNVPAAVAAEGQAATTDGLAGSGASSSSTSATAGAPKLSSTGRSFVMSAQAPIFVREALLRPIADALHNQKYKNNGMTTASKSHRDHSPAPHSRKHIGKRKTSSSSAHIGITVDGEAEDNDFEGEAGSGEGAVAVGQQLNGVGGGGANSVFLGRRQPPPAAMEVDAPALDAAELVGSTNMLSSCSSTIGFPSSSHNQRSLWQRKTALCSPTGTDSVDEKRRTEQLALASRACDALQNAYFFEAGLSHEDNTDGIAAGSQSAVNDMMQNLTNFVVDLPTFFKFPGATNDPLNVVRDLFALSRVGQEVSYHEEKASSNKKKADHIPDKNLHKIPMHGRLFGVQSGGGGAGGGKADGSSAKMKLTLMSIPASRGQRGQLRSWGSSTSSERGDGGSQLSYPLGLLTSPSLNPFMEVLQETKLKYLRERGGGDGAEQSRMLLNSNSSSADLQMSPVGAAGLRAAASATHHEAMSSLDSFHASLLQIMKTTASSNTDRNVVLAHQSSSDATYFEQRFPVDLSQVCGMRVAGSGARSGAGGKKSNTSSPSTNVVTAMKKNKKGAAGGSKKRPATALLDDSRDRDQGHQDEDVDAEDVDSRAPVTKAPAANEVSHLLDGGGTVGTPGAPAAAAAGITDMHQLRANPCFLVGQDKTDQNDLFFTLDQAERQRDNLRGGAGGGHLRSWPHGDGYGLGSSYTSAMSTLMYSKDFDRLGELHLKFWSDVHAIHIADGLKTSATGTSHSNPRETQMDRRFIADNRIDPESCASHSGSSHLSSPGAAPVSIRVVTSRRHIFLPKPNNPKFAVDRPFQVGPTVEQYIDPSFHFEDKVSKLNIAKDCSMLIEHHMQWQVRVEMAHIFQRFLLSRIRFLPAKMAASVAIVNQKRPQGYAVDAGELTKRKDGGGVAAALGGSGTATAAAASSGPAITGTSVRNNSSRTANLAGSRGTAALGDRNNRGGGQRGSSRNEKKKAQEAAAKKAASKCGLTGFEIMNNDNDPTGAMPPGWSPNYPLRPEQLRSLYWMQQREQVLDMNLELSETREEVSGALEVKFKRHLAADRAWLKTTTQTAAVPSTISSESRQASMFNQAAWSLEFEVSAQYTNRGGILADKIGFGKTATCIGLIASQKQADLEFLQRGCLREADADMELNRGGNVVLSPESSSSPSQGEVSGPATSDEEVNEDEADANKAEAGVVEDQEDDLLADENLDMLAKGPARKRRKVEPAAGGAGATTATGMKTAPGGPKSMKAAAAKKAAQSKTAAMKTAASKNKGPTAGGGKKNEDEEGEDGAGRTSASSSDHHSAGGAPAGTKLSFAMQCELLQMVEADKGGFFPAPKTTLILVPSHLIDQWSTEIEKFLPNNKLKILICKNISPLKIRSVYEIQQYDIILVTYRVLYSSIHQQRFEELSGLDVDKKKHEEDTRRNQAEMQKKGFASVYSGSKTFQQNVYTYNTFLEGAGRTSFLSSGALGRKPAEQSKAAVDQAFEQSTDRQNYITKLRENTRKYIEKGGNVRGSGSGKNDKFKAWSAKANVKEEVLFDPLAAGAATQQEAAPAADVDDAMEIDEDVNVEDKKPKLPAMKTASRSQAAASQASKGGARATAGTQSTTKVFDKIEKSEQYRLLQFPLLEQFYFRRIVFDEFHELEAFGDKQVSTLLNLKAFSKFGLTGTPQVDSVRNVAATASLFGIDLVGVSQIEAEYADRLWRFVTRTEFSARHVMDELAKSQPTYNFTKREGTLGSAIAYPARPQTQYFLKPMPDWICNCCLEPAWGTGADPSSATVTSAAQDPRMSPTTKVEFTCKHCGTKNHTSDLFFRGNQKPTTRRAAAGGGNVNTRAGGGAGAVHHGAATSNAVLMAQNPALAARAVSARAGASALTGTAGAGTAASAAGAAGSSSAVAADQQERLLPADDELPVVNASASLVSAAPAAALSEADVFGDASPMEIDDSPADSGNSEHLLSRLLDSEEMSDGGASSISDFAYGGRGTRAQFNRDFVNGRRMQYVYSDFSSDESCTDSEDLSSESDSLRNELRRERWEIDSRGRGGGARRNAVCYGHGGGPGSNHAILVAQALAEAPEKFHFHASARKFASQRMNYLRRCHPWDRSKIFRDNCERFLQRFVRQNSAVTDADKIVTKEHWIAVTHTAEERAIYLAQQNALNYTAAVDGGEGDGAAAERRRRADADGALDDLEKRARLLQLCSHFTLGEHSKADTGSECSRIFDRKQNAVKQALKQFKAAARQLAVVRAIYREDPEKRRQAFETVNQKMQTVCAGADLDSSSAVLGEEDESFNLALGNQPPGPATGMVLGLEGVMKKASAKGAANKTKRNIASSKKAADTDRRSSAVGPASESAGANAKKESGEGVNKQASSAAEKHSREATFYSEFPLQAAVVQKLMEQTEEKLSTSSAKKIFSSAETGRPLVDWEQIVSNFFVSEKEEKDGAKSGGANGAVGAASSSSRANNVEQQSKNGKNGSTKPPPFKRFVPASEGPPKKTATKEQKAAYDKQKWLESRLDNLRERMVNTFNREFENLREATNVFAFFKKTLQIYGGAGGSAESGGDSGRSCVLCMEDELPVSNLSITSCGHVFCVECIHRQMRAEHMLCGLCRKPLQQKDIYSLALEMRSAGVKIEAKAEQAKIDNLRNAEIGGHGPGGPVCMPVAGGVVVDPNAIKYDNDVISAEIRDPEKYAEFGSKIQSICQVLLHIEQTEPGAKVILFCQWKNLMQKIGVCLTKYGFAYATLTGGAIAQNKKLSEFKNMDNQGGANILLLSLETSAAGTNLAECCHHCLLVHPMNATTVDRAIAFELQAIGRIRRYGQQAAAIHVWRFLTLNSVEEEIVREHAKAIRERQETKKELLPAESGEVVL